MMQRLVLCVSLLFTSPAWADWPAFRGPTRDGVVNSRALPTTWTATENIVWRTPLPGQGWSSPVIRGPSIYVTAAVPLQSDSTKPGYQLELIILDATSGSIQRRVPLFEQPGDSPKIHKKNSHASPTPLLDGERVYVHFGHQGTACLTLGGEIVWRNDSLAYQPVHGNGGSPTIVDNLLIFSRDGAKQSRITALDKNTGSLVWQTERDVEADRKFSFCTPLVIEHSNRRQLILPGSNVVQSLDPSNGQEHWRLRYDGYSVIPRPIFESGLVFVCTGYNKPSLLAIDPSGQGDVTETHLKWRSNENIPHTPSLVAHKGRIALVSDGGIASCFDALQGEQLWKKRIGGNFSASPLLVDADMYLLSEEGDCTILNIESQPTVVAKNKLGERSLASMAVLENDLILRSANAIYRISER